MPQPDPLPRKSSSREWILIAGIGLALLVASFGWMRWRFERARQAPPADRSVRRPPTLAGEPSCRECHPGETANYHRSGHGQTLRLANDRDDLIPWLLDRKLTDPEHPGSTFSYRRTPRGLVVDRADPSGAVESTPIDFAFGSGHHATTFVTLTDRDPAHSAGIEHRLTYFAADHAMGITPGQEVASDVDPALKTPAGRILTTDQVRRCFDCHTTRLSADYSSALDLATMVPNVSCERCHGPASAHVEAARRGEAGLKMPFGSRRETALREIRLCGYCHRLPEMAPPGAIRPENPDLVRFQPVGLLNSRCYKEGGGKLSCTTCHDPHARASTDVPTYEAACLGCHQSPSKAACPVSPSKGCLDCHMPRRDAGQKILFTDHWIRVHPESGARAVEKTDPTR